MPLIGRIKGITTDLDQARLSSYWGKWKGQKVHT